MYYYLYEDVKLTCFLILCINLLDLQLDECLVLSLNPIGRQNVVLFIDKSNSHTLCYAIAK